MLSSLKATGLDTSAIQTVSSSNSQTGGRTAQYVAVNDGGKNLIVAMADMSIFEHHSRPEDCRATMSSTNPQWIVVDGNWSSQGLRSWIAAGHSIGSKVVFEPVSAEKSKRLFCPPKGQSRLGMFPQASLYMATPNTYELAAMYSAAKQNGYLDSHEWFKVIDGLGMMGARDRFVRLTSTALTDAGVPVQCVQLLPYIPTIVTKLGEEGVLLTGLLAPGDWRLKDPDAEEFILARSPAGHPTVGGIYMRLFPAVEKVEDIVSVNGVGDTFLGVLLSGLAQGGRVEDLIDVSQRAAVLSLKSAESVSPMIPTLEDDISRAVMTR